MLVAWFGLRPSESPLGFYLLFAGTAPVQVVAVYLVFASLIVPPLIASNRLIRGYALGILGYAAGRLSHRARHDPPCRRPGRAAHARIGQIESGTRSNRTA